MQVFTYHPETRMFMGVAEADPDPMTEGGWLFPAYTTPVKPPQPSPEELVFWDGNKWIIQPIPTTPAEEAEALKVELEVDQLAMLIQAKLDAFAQNRGYDSMVSACSYATSKVKRFAEEAKLAIKLRDTCWEVFCEMTDDGNVPTQDDLLGALPELTWGQA